MAAILTYYNAVILNQIPVLNWQKEDLAGLATAKDLHAVNVTLEKLLSSVSMVSQKVKSLETKITGVQSSMEKIKTTTDEHAATLKKLQDDFQETCAQNEDTKAECNKLKDKLDEIEDRSRRNNLLFAGIPQEDPAENWQQSQNVQSQGNVYCYYNNVLLIL